MRHQAAWLLTWSLLVGLLTATGSTAQTATTPAAPAAPTAPATPGTPPAPAGPSLITALADEVRGLFPQVDTDVLEVQGMQATVGAGKRDGVQPGIELSVYRQGRELRHPKTGQVLGHTEQPLGKMRITEVSEAYSVGTLGAGTAAVAGDRARVSAAVVPLTIVPFVDGVNRGLVEAALQELQDALTKSGRIRPVIGDQIAMQLVQEKVTPEQFLRGERLAAVAERFKLENVLAIHFKSVERKPFMDVRLFRAPRSEPLLTSALYVPTSVRRASDQAKFSGSGSRSNGTGPQKVKERSLLAKLLSGDWEPTSYSTAENSIPLKEVAKFPFPVRFMDVAVAPKDGIPGVVVSDGSRIYQYRVVNQAFEPDWTYSISSVGTMFSMQFADLDGDGLLEVVVNRYHYSPTRSFGMMGVILEQTTGKARPWVEDVNEIMLAVDETGSGLKRTLWTQRFSPEKFFTAGQADRVTVKDRKLVTVESVRVPDNFRATGATFSTINGKGAVRTLAYIDEYKRLRIVAGLDEIWRSSTPVGGGGTTLEVGLATVSRGGRSIFVETEPMPLVTDLDGDGVEEIIVPQNQYAGMLAVVYKGPAGFRVQSINSGFEGTITAFGAAPGADPTSPMLVAAVVRYTNTLRTTGETQIIITLPTE